MRTFIKSTRVYVLYINIFVYIYIYRAGRSDTPTLPEVDLGVGVEYRKSGVKNISSRGVESPVLSSDTSTLF